jgi:hypothetical protein
MICGLAVSSPLAAQMRHPNAYVGVNPIAALSLLPSPIGALLTAFGFVTGAESGLAVYGGWEFAAAHSIEVRAATGPANLIVWETQVQIGYLWYPCESFLGWNGGPSVSLFARNHAFFHELTRAWFFNHVPELCVGWRWWIGRFAIDLRAGWNIASITWATEVGTGIGVDWIAPPFGFTFCAGAAFGFQLYESNPPPLAAVFIHFPAYVQKPRKALLSDPLADNRLRSRRQEATRGNIIGAAGLAFRVRDGNG